jgi:hypothetical protein
VSTRTPWWYSGDGDEYEASVEPFARAAAADVASTQPAGADRSADGAGEEDESNGGGGRDWTALVAGAQRMVDWATERVMAPHAEHADPREHPDCVLCRTMTVLGDVGLRSPAPDPAGDRPTAAADHDDDDSDDGDLEGDDAPDEARGPRGRAQIEWIPIRGELLEP